MAINSSSLLCAGRLYYGKHKPGGIMSWIVGSVISKDPVLSIGRKNPMTEPVAKEISIMCIFALCISEILRKD